MRSKGLSNRIGLSLTRLFAPKRVLEQRLSYSLKVIADS